MKKEEATEGATVTLHCELNKAAPVEWRKGPETLRAGDRVSLRQDGAVCELEIRDLTEEDAGEYSCVCGQERTSATLTIRGKDGPVDLLGSLYLCPCFLCPHWLPMSACLLCVVCSFFMSPLCSPVRALFSVLVSAY